MQVNPINVLNLLLAVFQSMNIPQTPVSSEEIELAAGLENVLKEAMNDFLNIEYIHEDGLGFQEEFRDWAYIAVDDNEDAGDLKENFSEYQYIEYDDEEDKSFEGKRKACSKDNEQVSFEYKKNAVRFWRGCKKSKRRSLVQVQHHYPKVISIKQLYRWEEQVQLGGTYMEKIFVSLR